MNGAEKIVNAMKKVNKSNQQVPSQIISATVVSIEPLVFQLENRLKIDSNFYELSGLTDWKKVKVGDVFKGFSFNEGQKYYILDAIASASTSGSDSSILAQVQNTISNAVIPIGGGCDYFGAIEPENFLFADGRALNITDYIELYLVIGETYRKADNLDISTFNIPDKRERITVMKEDTGIFNELGKTGGEERHTLTINEMPKHNHSLLSQDSGGDGSYNDWHAEFKFANNSNIINVQSGSNKIQTSSGPTSGGGQSHNNLQPYLVCNYIIRVK